VQRGHQTHAVEGAQQEAQQVALVIVGVPDFDALLAADPDQTPEHREVQRAAVGNRQDFGAQRPSASDERLDPRIVRRMEVGELGLVTQFPQESWRVEDRFFRPAAVARDDADVQHQGAMLRGRVARRGPRMLRRAGRVDRRGRQQRHRLNRAAARHMP
jgi:hypothetical protein